MPGRSYSADEYRYGFNGMEKDDEVKGSGNSVDFGGMGYDPRIAKRWIPDPMAGKYAFLSSYAVFNNNPIIYIDKDGYDWEITTTFDKDGNETIHVKITAAIINSSATKVDMAKFQAAVVSQIETSYTVKWSEASKIETINLNSGLDRPANNLYLETEFRDVNVSVEVNIRTITDKKDLASNEHLIDIVDDKDITSESNRKDGYSTLGEAPFNGKYIRINANATTGIILGIDNKTVPHEFGHTGGLYHPNEGAGFFGYFQSDQYMEDGTQDNNLMYQSAYSKNNLKNTGDGNEVNGGQIRKIKSNYDAGDLNKENIPDD